MLFVDGYGKFSGESGEKLGTVEAQKSATFIANSSTSHAEGHVCRIDLAEVEEEQDILHLIFFKSKVAVSATLFSDQPNCLALHQQIVPVPRDGSVLLSERYIIYRVLRI
jgi:hypothetical protein